MTKALIIEFNEKDENVLLQIFDKFKVKVKASLSNEELEEKMEQETIRATLRQKYVTTGEWENMTLEAKEDAALYEKIMLVDRDKTVDMSIVKAELRKQIANKKQPKTNKQVIRPVDEDVEEIITNGRLGRKMETA
jgi:hypothetical protein